jgi:hypothetical protein
MPWLAGDTPFGIIDDLSGILGHVFLPSRTKYLSLNMLSATSSADALLKIVPDRLDFQSRQS